MTLEEAKECIREGFPFGDVYPEVDAEEKQALKDWYVREEGLPNVSARGGFTETKVIEYVAATIYAGPTTNGVAKPTFGYTGDTCIKCQGCRMVRTGTCLRCEDCGETSGGCG